MTTQKAMPHRAGALGLPSKYSGVALFECVCELDLEGIVGEEKARACVTEREQSTSYKIRNRSYSQMAGHEELLERDRGSEPVPGWHSCELACADVEG